MTTAAGGRFAGRDVREADVEPLTWAMYERALTLNVLDHLTAQSRLESVARSIVSWMLAQPLDVIVTPALAARPLPHRRGPRPGTRPMGQLPASGAFTPYTAMMNVTGQPAVSLPLYHGDDGLPLAVQLIGQPAREDVLLALGAQLEAALPWADRTPHGLD